MKALTMYLDEMKNIDKVSVMMMMPRLMKPWSSGMKALTMYLDEMKPPKLPPAPTMPETTPSAGRETYGTTPKWRPSAIWTAHEKQIMTIIVTPSGATHIKQSR